ncbi:MAG: site-specific integrase [Clostridia bacterium]|nr:site-specific integrase [Clostridia bacterium]
MKVSDAIVEFGFDCKVRKLSEKTVANYLKQLRYIQKYLNDEFQITEIEEIKKDTSRNAQPQTSRT